VQAPTTPQLGAPLLPLAPAGPCGPTAPAPPLLLTVQTPLAILLNVNVSVVRFDPLNVGVITNESGVKGPVGNPVGGVPEYPVPVEHAGMTELTEAVVRLKEDTLIDAVVVAVDQLVLRFLAPEPPVPPPPAGGLI